MYLLYMYIINIKSVYVICREYENDGKIWKYKEKTSTLILICSNYSVKMKCHG